MATSMAAGPQHSAAAESQQIFLSDELCHENQGLKDTEDQSLPEEAGEVQGWMDGGSYLLSTETGILVTCGFPEAAPHKRDVDPSEQPARCCLHTAPHHMRARQVHSSTLQFQGLANVTGI